MMLEWTPRKCSRGAVSVAIVERIYDPLDLQGTAYLALKRARFCPMQCFRPSKKGM